jgi:hypothetical protein
MNNPRSSEASPSPAVHSENIRGQLTELIEHLEADLGRVDDARFRGLLEKSTEVLKGLRSLFERFQPTRETTQGKGTQPPREPSKTQEPRDAAPSSNGNSVNAAGRDRSKAVSAPPGKAATKPSSQRKISAKAPRTSPTPRAKASPAAASAKGGKATRQKNTGSKPGKSRDVPVQAKPAPANGAKPQDPAELNARIANQRKEARAPMMPQKSAPKPMPPQSGKPIWAKPHSS